MKALDLPLEIVQAKANRLNAAAAGKSPVQAWQAVIGGHSLNAEKNWLRGLGATGETITDLWGSFVPGPGNLKDRMMRYFRS